jgi:hypothetical protein
MVNWDNLVLSPSLGVVGDSLVWHGDIPFSSVVLMSVVGVSEGVVAVTVVSVFESDSAVLILLVVGAVLDLVIGLVINELVSDGVVLSLSALNMWGNLMDGCLLERSVV